MRGGDPKLNSIVYNSYIVFPACAGVILETEWSLPELEGFPRMRGGDPIEGT